MGEFNFQLVIPCGNARNCDRRKCRMWHEDDPPERREELEEETIRKIKSLRGRGGGRGKRHGSKELWKETKKTKKTAEEMYKVTGMNNLRNTCYLNTIIQSLASCKIFMEKLLQEDEEHPNKRRNTNT